MHENMTLKSSSAMNGPKLFILGDWQKCEKWKPIRGMNLRDGNIKWKFALM